MSQKGNSVNFLIRDANGQPQMIKVVQSSTATKQAVGQIQLSPVRNYFKVPAKPEASAQSNTAALYKAVNVAGFKGGSKIVQLPVQTIGQLQKVTVVNPNVQAASAKKKVQTQSASGATKVVNTVSFVPEPEPQNPPMSPPTESKSHISSILTHSSRKRQDSVSELITEYTSKRRKAADKVGKGLRHFSMKVCEKVRKKGFTSYNEVADELVAEFTAGIHGSPDNQQYDQKNIRRRVYDALNVLMAMNIISKEKKEIRWLGLPTNSIQECNTLEREKQMKIDRIKQKTQQLHDLILQQISFKSLVERNKSAESRGLTPSPSSAIQLPFIVVNTCDKALIDCSISNDKMEYVFNFNEKFQIHDDIDILKRMGLLLGLDKGQCSDSDIQKAKSMVPKSLESYIEQLGRGATMDVEDLLNINIKNEEMSDDGEGDGDDDLEGECEDSYGGNYSDEDQEEELDSSSDVDVNGE